MKTVALHNLGCKVNGYEMDVMQQKLQENGYIIVPFDEAADIYIINTCTVTNIADRKSRQMLHRAKKRNPRSVVVAVGCYVQTGTEQVLQDLSVDIAIGNNKKGMIVEILDAYFASKEQKGSEVEAFCDHDYIIDINHTSEYETMHLDKPGEHTRAYIKIQDGCNQFCSYCIIPFARGRVRSREQKDILQEVRTIAANGCREVVLTGIHISSYGVDFPGKESELLSLVQSIHQVEGIERIRLGSLEPRIVTEAFAREIAGLPKICPHFHLSLQSGCDDTLKRMNRKYTAAEYMEGVKYLRKYFDNPAITTDVIVGFPGETEEDFAICRDFLDQIHFYEMHIFKYSKRQGTRAAEMKDQVPEPVKSQRSDILLSMEAQMSKAYRESFLGKAVEVLYEESIEKDGMLYQIGHTKEYVRFAKRTEEDLSGRIYREVPTGFLEDDILI